MNLIKLYTEIISDIFLDKELKFDVKLTINGKRVIWLVVQGIERSIESDYKTHIFIYSDNV